MTRHCLPVSVSISRPRPRHRLAGLGLTLGLSLLGGCSVFAPPTQLHGIQVDKDDIAQLVTGTSTRADVAAALGSPTMKASFDDNTWIYISERTYLRIAQTPGVEDLVVYAISFDDDGILRGVRRLDEKDSQPVNVVSAKTQSPGTEASFLQQLLGNVGKFTPAGAGAGPGGQGAAGGGLGSNGGGGGFSGR